MTSRLPITHSMVSFCFGGHIHPQNRHSLEMVGFFVSSFIKIFGIAFFFLPFKIVDLIKDRVF